MDSRHGEFKVAQLMTDEINVIYNPRETAISKGVREMLTCKKAKTDYGTKWYEIG